MNIFPKKGKTSKKRKNEKLFGAPKKRKSENSWKKIVTKKTVLKSLENFQKNLNLFFPHKRKKLVQRR